MMQSCASAAKLRSGGPILPIGMKAKGHVGIPPPRTIIGARHKRTDKTETVEVPSASSIHCAGRKTTPSVRARNHCAKALFFWNMSNRHAN